ncbi:FAD-binding oxidoreductase [Undibacterium sp. Ji67W]|uniref:FAD-binding oxidoreductase n=1 Tax=Undibacterium sp. Ji67W TaxID=3413042 RepID=UPI003BEFE500
MVTMKLIDELKSIIGGTVALPNESAYLHAITLDNGRAQREPAAIIFPINAKDIANVLKFSKQHQITVTVRGGGHSANGYCLNNSGFVIDMCNLVAKHIDTEHSTLRMQAGVSWLDVYQFLGASNTGLIPVGGACSTVGVGGFILGGGLSWVSRSLGMAIDSLLEIMIVTADGDIKTIERDAYKSKEDEDLFWACQGGGGGNFGIVVEMKIQLHRTNTPTIFGGSLSFPIEQIQEILSFYNEWILTVPDTLAVYGYLGMTPPEAGQQVQALCLTAVYNGSYEEGFELISPLLKFKPIYTNIYNTSLIDYEIANGKFTLVENRDAYIRSAVFAPGALTPEVAEIFKRNMLSAPSSESFATWMHTGGRIKAKRPDETAYPHREAEFVFQLKTIWDDPTTAFSNVAWGYQFVEELLVHANGGYVNYIDPLLHDWKVQYYGSNRERLEKIKKHVDPENVFHFQQAVNSDFNPEKLDFSRPETVDLSPLNRTNFK